MHTPGKWVIDKRVGYHIMTESLNEAIAEIMGQDEESKANANLIASAPVMYEVLQYLKNRFQVRKNIGVQVSFAVRAIEVIDEALKQAEGKDE